MAGNPLSPRIRTIDVAFFASRVIKQQKSCILKIYEKTPNFGRTVHTQDYAENLKLEFSEAYFQRSIGIYEKIRKKTNLWMILRGSLKKQQRVALQERKEPILLQEITGFRYR